MMPLAGNLGDVSHPVTVRVMRLDEFAAMRELSIAAFGGDQNIGQLLDALRESWAWEDDLSFVAEDDGQLVGHVLYSHAILDTPRRLQDVLVLSPVGVCPDWQQHGIGGELIAASLTVLRLRSEPLVFLEGHPDYYSRFGFVRAGELGFVAPSVRIPAAAFMVHLMPSYEPSMTGALVYPDAFWRADAVGLRDESAAATSSVLAGDGHRDHLTESEPGSDPEPGGTVTLSETNSRAVLTLTGELDHFADRGLRDHVAAIVEQPPRELFVDAADATFIDSFVVGQLFRLDRAVTSAGGTVSITASPNVRRTVELVGLQHLLC
jgi:putative acetyltransferase